MYIKSTDLVSKCITGLAKVNIKAFIISVKSTNKLKLKTFV